MAIKQVPERVKAFGVRKPKATHSRSVNKELRFVFTRENEHRERIESPNRQDSDIMRTLDDFRRLPVLNADASEKMLYDAQGLPE